MKKILHINLIVSLFIAICVSNDFKNIAFYNFSSAMIDQDNRISDDLSEKIRNSFIDLIKDDFQSIQGLHFIPTKTLDKEINRVRSLLLQKIKSHLEEDITTVVTPKKLGDIIKEVSKDRFSNTQINIISDSLMIFISKMTKNLTKDMIMSNKIKIDEPSEITMRDFLNFIDNTTEGLIRKNTLSSFITSSSKKFEVDIIITGDYKIDKNQIKVNFYIYDYETLDFIGEVYGENSIDKAHVLIKDLEFKLLNKISVLHLNDDIMKAQLCKFNINNFSKSDNSLYLSNFFSTEDIKELKIRFQLSEDFNLISYYYKSLFESLMNTKVPFYLKFYSNESYYPLQKINFVGDENVDISFPNSKEKTIISDGNINYLDIQGIKFGKDK